MMKALTALTGLLLATAAAMAGYLPKGSPSAGGARNIVLIYNSGDYHRNWQQADFVPLLAYRDAAGRLKAPMFDSLLVLPLKAPSGRSFCPGFAPEPSNASDWSNYADLRLFGGDDHLHHLDAAAGQVKSLLNAPSYRWKVFLTLPYPDPAQRAFGPVDSAGRSLDLALAADRLTAVRWYIAKVSAQWKAAGFQNLDLVGWYWVQEDVLGADQTLLPAVSTLVHADGRKFLWIPYYKAPGYSRWHDWGFDAAIHQPNYFFTDTLPVSRITDTATAASQYAMGMEMELDERVLTSDAYRQRYKDYLNAGSTERFQANALTAWYMGCDALLQCAGSTNAAVRAVYDETWSFIAEVAIPGDVDGNQLVDTSDVLKTLAIGAGLKRGTDPGIDFRAADVSSDARITVRDAVKTLRAISGLQPTLP